MGLENILPTYHRSPTKLPISLNKLCRSKERVLLGFVCFGLVVACFGTVFFLPELRTGIALPSLNSVYKVYEHVQKVGPEFILQLPPLAKDDIHEGKSQQHHGQIDKPDFHLLEDQARLRAKIETEERLELEQNQLKVLPKPMIPSSKSETGVSGSTTQPDGGIKGESSVTVRDQLKNRLPMVQGGGDLEPDIRAKRETVRKV